MRQQNIIALCLGIFAAALLWQYYLWPKYQLKQESPEVIALIEESAQKELEESVDSGEAGEVLFIGETSTDQLSNAPKMEDGLVFYSQANKPKDLFEQMSKDETKKYNSISIDNEDFVVDPSTVGQAGISENYQGDDSRITMLQLPADFLVIKDSKTYEKFLSENEGNYPKVDFNKEGIAVILSAGKFSDTFFEIVKIETTDNEIKIFYRVNLIFANKEKEQRNYKLIENVNLPVNFIQVK